MSAQGWAEQSQVANDVFAVLWAATGTGHGVAVTVGAGVNCVGMSPSGRRAWFPALGDITGDWGGGPDIGMAALGAGVRSEDGRGPHTALAGAVAAYFGYATALEVAVAIHQGILDSARLVELPPLVITAAEAGDDEAIAIMRRQGSEVTRLAIAALHQLEMEDAPVQVVLGGSGARLQPVGAAGLHRRRAFGLSRRAEGADEPVHGAARRGRGACRARAVGRERAQYREPRLRAWSRRGIGRGHTR